MADAAFIQCVVNAADRKAAWTFSSYFEKSILVENKDEEKDESKHLMGLLTLVSLALNNVEDPAGKPTADLIPFIEWIKYDKTFQDPIHYVAAIMLGSAKNEVSSPIIFSDYRNNTNPRVSVYNLIKSVHRKTRK